MGIFDWIKRDSKSEKAATLVSVPTIKPPPELFDTHREIFQTEMATIGAFSSVEILEMLEQISKTSGGFLNRGDYYKQVFESYFKDRSWAWPEYEKWKRTFEQLGKWPTRWQHIRMDKESPPDEVLELLKVSDIKALLTQIGVVFPPKATKPALIAQALKQQPKLSENLPAWNEAQAELANRNSYSMYTILMRTIEGRAICLNQFSKQERIGYAMSGKELIHTFEEDKEFANMALAENPNALTPLYPFDSSFWKPIVKF